MSSTNSTAQIPKKGLRQQAAIGAVPGAAQIESTGAKKTTPKRGLQLSDQERQAKAEARQCKAPSNFNIPSQTLPRGQQKRDKLEAITGRRRAQTAPTTSNSTVVETGTRHSETPEESRADNPPVPQTQLVIATPIEEPNLPVAAMDLSYAEQNQRTLFRKKLSLWFGAGFILVLVAITVGAVFGTRDNRNNQPRSISSEATFASPTISSSPSQAPSFSSIDLYIKSLLPTATTQAIVTDPASPQALALAFLVEEHNHSALEELAEWRIHQRFALSTLYYATGGPTHWDLPSLEQMWLDQTKHECDWWSRGAPSAFGIDECYHMSEVNKTHFQVSSPCNTEMRALSLSQNQLTWIPSELGAMTGMTSFELQHNKLSSIPTDLGLMTAMSYLDLQENELVSIPSQLALMTAIDFLRLSNNILHSLPSELGLMTANRYLYLGNNGLTSIPSEYGLMTAVSFLDLGQNTLSSIPPALGHMTAIESLVAPNNKLLQIPSELGLMTSMTVLDLSTNLLTSIPSEIGLIRPIISLSLQNNALPSIPSEFGLMENIEFLLLSHNQLTTLPEEIELIATNGSLASLMLQGNALSGTMPACFCSLGPPTIWGTGLFFDCGANVCGCNCPCPGWPTGSPTPPPQWHPHQ